MPVVILPSAFFFVKFYADRFCHLQAYIFLHETKGTQAFTIACLLIRGYQNVLQFDIICIWFGAI
jgi:hypothetical protein